MTEAKRALHEDAEWQHLESESKDETKEDKKNGEAEADTSSAGVKRFLVTCKMEQYFDTFVENGFDSVAALERLEEKHLERIGVKLGHIVLVLEALKEWQEKRRAEADAKAAAIEFAAGVKCERGDGVRRDMLKAYKHFQRAMELGSVDAKVKVASFLLCGFGAVKSNERFAFTLLTEAHEAGATSAHYWLGESLFWGLGCEQDEEGAKELWSRSGDVFSQAALFEDNQSVDANAAAPELVEKLQKMADSGDSHALYLLSEVVRAQGDSDKQVELLLQVTMMAEHSWAQNALGLELADTDKTGADREAAMDWFRQAAQQGDPTAAYNLARCYCDSKGAPKDKARYLQWLRVAATAGDCDAQYQLGTYYRDGMHGLAVDKREAEQWLQRAAQAGDQDAVDALHDLQHPVQADQPDPHTGRWNTVMRFFGFA